MNPKEYWEEADRLRRRIKRKENEILSLRERAEGMTGMSDGDMPKTASPDPHKMEIAVCKIIELEQEVQEIQTELDLLMINMKTDIQQIQDDEARDLLTKRYLEFKPWKVIASEMFICERQAYYLHREGLKLLS